MLLEHNSIRLELIKYKFSRNNPEFISALRSRVNQYFSDNGITKSANADMVTKTVLALTLYLAPFLLIIIGSFDNLVTLFSLWVIMGIGKAFVGTSVMHDALHGAYTKKKNINELIGFSGFLVGANPGMWKIQHNILHHTYTNIEHADEDISPRYVLRFTPHQPRKWFHRYQHLYAAFFYSISVILWVTIKDFRQLIEYSKLGLISKGADFNKTLLEIVIHRVVYFSIFLAIPIMILPNPVWLTVLMYLAMEAVTGLILTLIFQTAHVMPESTFVAQSDEKIEEDWAIHQLRTTTNYGTKNKWLSWFTGSLNFQVEHHLFPDICHVHYPELSKIVKRTAQEFGLPYHEIDSFKSALKQHFSLLKFLGQQDNLDGFPNQNHPSAKRIYA